MSVRARPKEFHDWVSYCNAPAGPKAWPTNAPQRQPRSVPVKYWGVGNESWGCGGDMTPGEYATAYRQFVTQFPVYVRAVPDRHRTRAVTPATWISAGRRDSSRRCRAAIAAPFTASRRTSTPISATTRCASPTSTPPDWYAVLREGLRTEAVIEAHWATMGKYDPDHRTKLVIDEWGVWYKPGEEIAPRLHPEPAGDAARRAAHGDHVRHLQPPRRQDRDGQRGADRSTAFTRSSWRTKTSTRARRPITCSRCIGRTWARSRCRSTCTPTS